MMRTLFIIICTVLPWLYSKGQDAITADPQRMGTLYAIVHVDIKGTPFFRDNWETGTVQLVNGTVLTDLQLRYNVADDMPLYHTGDEKTWKFTSPVKSFTLSDGKLFMKGTDGFYEVLVEGKYNLYKKHIKAIFEQRPYGSSTMERRFRDNAEYFTGSLDSLVKIKISRSFLSKYFKDSQDKFKEVTKDNRLRNEEDIIQLFNDMN